MPCIWLKQSSHSPDFGQTGEKGQKQAKDHPCLLLKGKTNTLFKMSNTSQISFLLGWIGQMLLTPKHLPATISIPAFHTGHLNLNRKKPPVHNFGRRMDVQLTWSAVHVPRCRVTKVSCCFCWILFRTWATLKSMETSMALKASPNRAQCHSPVHSSIFRRI